MWGLSVGYRGNVVEYIYAMWQAYLFRGICQ